MDVWEKVYVNEFLINMDDDFIDVLVDNIDGMVDSHIETWVEKYYPNSVENISYLLYVEHDISLEVEFIEDELGRDLTIVEHEVLKKYFNESVLNEFR